MPTFERLADLTGGDELAARFLTCYRPPAYLAGCSQAALIRKDGSVLVRNYDLDPQRNDGVIFHTKWTGTEVMATTEFIWGVADGMNGHGLGLSLAFGGRKVVGDGFGIPLILRYFLEVCTSTGEAIETLGRIPSHMAYNVTLLDPFGVARTVQVSPDHATPVRILPVATNHQGKPERRDFARRTRTMERETFLRMRLADPHGTCQNLISSFLTPPLFSSDYQQGFGTLYTAAYFPSKRTAEWHWPGKIWRQSLNHFKEGSRTIELSSGVPTEKWPAEAVRALQTIWGHGSSTKSTELEGWLRDSYRTRCPAWGELASPGPTSIGPNSHW